MATSSAGMPAMKRMKGRFSSSVVIVVIVAVQMAEGANPAPRLQLAPYA